MVTSDTRFRPRLACFLVTAVCVYGAVFLISRSVSDPAHVSRVRWAALADLTLTVPALYYILLVRPGLSSGVPLVAIALAGARAGPWILPEGGAAQMALVPWLLVPAEIWLVFRIVRQVRRGIPGGCESADPLDRIAASVRTILRAPILASVVAMEIGVLYYALFSWRAKAQVPNGAQGVFAAGEASGYRLFVQLLSIAIVFEGIAVHLLLQRWMPIGVWVFTGADMYALLWLIAIARSLTLRPMAITTDTLHLRLGLLWQAAIPVVRIASIRRLGMGEALPAAGCRALTFLHEPQLCVEFVQPVAIRGPLGIRRTVSAIAIALDEPEAFGAVLSARLQQQKQESGPPKRSAL